MRILYTLIYSFLLPFILLRLYWRGRLAPAYRQRWAERLSLTRMDSIEGGIWLHAVSVGETIAAIPIVEALLENQPQRKILLTTTTPTGSERVRKAFGARVSHCYAPYDLPLLLNRFIRQIRPSQVLIMETELWPNMLHCLAKQKIPTYLLNARLSAKSQKGYLKFPSLSRNMLANLTGIACQHQPDADRFRQLGADDAQLIVTGSVKNDLKVAADLASQAELLVRHWQRNGPVWIAASTHIGEDEKILQAHRLISEKIPGSGLILVPRHPERFNSTAELILQRGFRLQRRSEIGKLGDEETQTADVFLGDSMGEMMALFYVADVAFVAGSLNPIGGHNPLEPAALAKPVLSGSHVFNFADIYDELVNAGGAEIVEDEFQLAKRVIELFQDKEKRMAIGGAAQDYQQSNEGVVEKVIQFITANR